MDKDYKYFLVTLIAPYWYWEQLQQSANDNQAQLLAIDGIALRSITAQDQEEMCTRQDASFLFEVLETSPEQAKNILDVIYEDALERYEEEEDE